MVKGSSCQPSTKTTTDKCNRQENFLWDAPNTSPCLVFVYAIDYKYQKIPNQESNGYSFIYLHSLSMIASVISLVEAFPPISLVKIPAAKLASTACSTRPASS